jgi:hypothetical protein
MRLRYSLVIAGFFFAVLSDQCFAQSARLTVYNYTRYAIRFDYSSDLIPVVFGTQSIDPNQSLTFVVAVKPNGKTNFIAVGEVLQAFQSLPGVKFQLQSGDQKYLTLRDTNVASPSPFYFDVTSDEFFRGLFGKENLEAWQKSIKVIDQSHIATKQ